MKMSDVILGWQDYTGLITPKQYMDREIKQLIDWVFEKPSERAEFLMEALEGMVDA